MADKEEAEVLTAASKLPLDERVAHSNWKARVAAYEAIKAGCNNVFDPSDPVLGEYGEY
jgi:cytoskeleton-associated protein 5